MTKHNDSLELRIPRDIVGEELLLCLYRQWAKIVHCTDFMTPSPGLVKKFREWFSRQRAPREAYELEFLAEYWRQIEG